MMENMVAGVRGGAFGTTGMVPYIYVVAGGAGYFIAPIFGGVQRVTDIKGALDWWINAPWMVDVQGRAVGVALYGLA